MCVFECTICNKTKINLSSSIYYLFASDQKNKQFLWKKWLSLFPLDLCGNSWSHSKKPNQSVHGITGIQLWKSKKLSSISKVGLYTPCMRTFQHLPVDLTFSSALRTSATTWLYIMYDHTSMDFPVRSQVTERYSFFSS